MTEEHDDGLTWDALPWVNTEIKYNQRGDTHHPDDAFHVHEIVLKEVESEDGWEEVDSYHPTWRGILQLPERIMCEELLCAFICLQCEGAYHEGTEYWRLLIHDTSFFEECPFQRKYTEQSYRLGDLHMFAAQDIGLLLHIVPSFINENSWSIESHSFMHPLRRAWVHELFQMVHHGRFLLERVIGGTPDHGLEYAVHIGLKGKSTIQDVMQLVSVGEWLPSIPELADGARRKLTVEQLVAHQQRHSVHLAEAEAKCKPFDMGMVPLVGMPCFESWAFNFKTFITQGKVLMDIALAKEVVSSTRYDVEQHVDPDGNVTKKHKST